MSSIHSTETSCDCTSRISAVVLALLVGLEVVRIALTAGVYELLAVAGLGVEPPAIRVRSTVTLQQSAVTLAAGYRGP